MSFVKLLGWRLPMALGSEFFSFSLWPQALQFVSLFSCSLPFSSKNCYTHPLHLYNLHLYIYGNFSLQLTLKTNGIKKGTGKNTCYTLNCTNLHHTSKLHNTLRMFEFLVSGVGYYSLGICCTHTSDTIVQHTSVNYGWKRLGV